MSQFLGTHQNRLDAKGRVSVPAQFRAELRAGSEGEGPVKLVLRPSHKHHCIECWPTDAFAALAAPLAKLDPFSDAYEDMRATIYGDAYSVESDKEGRILLNEDMVKYAGLTNQVAFMGLGDIFQIWDPEAAKRRREEARQGAKLRGTGIPGGLAA